MPRKTKQATPANAGLPEIPKELLDQFVTGPMTAEAVMRRRRSGRSTRPRGGRSRIDGV